MKTKRITSLLIMILLLIFSVQAQKKDKNKTETGWNYEASENGGFEYGESPSIGYNDLNKKARHFFKSIVYVEGGTYTSGPYQQIHASEKDSTLIINEIARRITVNSFFISQYEVIPS